jgi:hypothetical protein
VHQVYLLYSKQPHHHHHHQTTRFPFPPRRHAETPAFSSESRSSRGLLLPLRRRLPLPRSLPCVRRSRRLPAASLMLPGDPPSIILLCRLLREGAAPLTLLSIPTRRIPPRRALREAPCPCPATLTASRLPRLAGRRRRTAARVANPNTSVSSSLARSTLRTRHCSLREERLPFLRQNPARGRLLPTPPARSRSATRSPRVTLSSLLGTGRRTGLPSTRRKNRPKSIPSCLPCLLRLLLPPQTILSSPLCCLRATSTECTTSCLLRLTSQQPKLPTQVQRLESAQSLLTPRSYR